MSYFLIQQLSGDIYCSAYLLSPRQVRFIIMTPPRKFKELKARWGYRYDNSGHYYLSVGELLSCNAQNDIWDFVLSIDKIDISVVFFESGISECWYSEGGCFNSLADALSSPFLIPRIDSIDIDYYLPLLPDWVEGNTLYEIFVDRFRKHEDRPGLKSWQEAPPLNDFYHKTMYGGSLQGIIHSIIFDGRYLQELGIGAIYLTPVFASPSSHKYDTEDYYEVDKSFGSFEDLKGLVNVAHDNGIKVILDGVFNHCSDKLRIIRDGERISLFKDITKNKKASKYRDWVFWESDTQWRGFAHLSHLPVLNTTCNDCADYLIDVAVYWSNALNIDGWRLDVANELSPSFLRELRNKLIKIKPDIWLFGEILHFGNRWINKDMLSGITNHHWREYITRFLVGNWDSSKLDSYLQQLWFQYPSTLFPCLINYLSNHDTARIMTVIGGEYDYETRIRLCEMACVLLFTSIGTPMIYYGDEIGMEGESDPDCRRCMEWDKNYWSDEQKLFRPRLHTTYKKMIELRKNCPWLSDGIWETVMTGPGKIYVFKRKSIKTHINNNDNFEEIVVLLNAGPENNTLQLSGLQHKTYSDVISGEIVAFDDYIEVNLNAYSFRVIAHYKKM